MLKSKQLEEGFYLDQAKVLEVGKQIKIVEGKQEQIKLLKWLYDDCKAYVELLEEEHDPSLEKDVEDSLHKLEKEVAKAKIRTLLKGKYDSYDAIITIHSGVGYKKTVLDLLNGDEAGIKSITFEVSGENAYGFLKAEKGVHRLVRISPFDANARRHTSFASVEVMPKMEQSPNIAIRSEDLKIDTYRSSGAGGQNVNKTESAVRITHIPTGIVVSCQVERSQVQNKERAMSMLYSRLAEKEEREELEKLANIRGVVKKIEWGSQIRSYVFCPYTLVKDHRTGYEDSNIQSVMDGNIQEFINEYLKQI